MQELGNISKSFGSVDELLVGGQLRRAQNHAGGVGERFRIGDGAKRVAQLLLQGLVQNDASVIVYVGKVVAPAGHVLLLLVVEVF